MKDDTISRQAAIDALIENKEMINAVLDSLTLDYNTRKNQEQRRGQINEDIETIKALLSAELEPKTGKWYIDEEGDVRCTACKTKCLRDDIGINILSNYCPSCGAKMVTE